MLFEDWFAKVAPEIEKTGLQLSLSLDSEPEGLINDLMRIEALNARIGELRSIADSYLSRAKLIHLPSSSHGFTENERKTIVEEKVADIRKVRDILESYQDSIKQRLILGESILAYQRQFYERSISGLSAAQILASKT